MLVVDGRLKIFVQIMVVLVCVGQIEESIERECKLCKSENIEQKKFFKEGQLFCLVL